MEFIAKLVSAKYLKEENAEGNVLLSFTGDFGTFKTLVSSEFFVEKFIVNDRVVLGGKWFLQVSQNIDELGLNLVSSVDVVEGLTRFIPDKENDIDVEAAIKAIQKAGEELAQRSNKVEQQESNVDNYDYDEEDEILEDTESKNLIPDDLDNYENTNPKYSEDPFAIGDDIVTDYAKTVSNGLPKHDEIKGISKVVGELHDDSYHKEFDPDEAKRKKKEVEKTISMGNRDDIRKAVEESEAMEEIASELAKLNEHDGYIATSGNEVSTSENQSNENIVKSETVEESIPMDSIINEEDMEIIDEDNEEDSWF